MRKDTEMISRQFDDDEIEIYAVGDLHYGSDEFLEEEWHKFCRFILEAPNRYLLLVGDMIENATRSSVGNGLFTQIMSPSAQKRSIAQELSPLKGRILCYVPGNHEARSGKDADDAPGYDICSKLDIEDVYRPNAAFVKISLGSRKQHSHSVFVICATHGAGGGIFTGASVNRAERFGNIIDGIDILVTGHTHKAHTSKPSKLVINTQHNTVTQRPYYAVSVGAWVRYGGYALQKMLLPSSPALQIIKLGRIGRTIEVTTR